MHGGEGAHPFARSLFSFPLPLLKICTKIPIFLPPVTRGPWFLATLGLPGANAISGNHHTTHNYTNKTTTMSSNQPPTTDPIDDTNTLFTPEPRRRTDFNVITQQDSENASQRLDFSSTLSQDDRDRFQTHQHYYTEDWLTSHGETESSPLVEPSTFAHVPATPTVDSPTITRTQIRDVMDANTSEMKEITAVARSMVFMSNSSSQKRFTPKTSILAFLRRDVLEAETKLLEDKGISIFDTAATLSQAKRAFYTKRGTAVAHIVVSSPSME